MVVFSDRDLIEALKRDEPQAYTRYTQAYGETLFRYIAARTHNLQDAEDIHQRLLLKAMKTWRADQGSLKSWLYMLAQQAIAEWARTKPPESVSLDKLMEDGVEPTFKGITPLSTNRLAALKQQLHSFVGGFPARERALFQLCIVEEQTDLQVADLFGVKPDSVKTMRCRMVKKIKEALQQQAVSHSDD